MDKGAAIGLLAIVLMFVLNALPKSFWEGRPMKGRKRKNRTRPVSRSNSKPVTPPTRTIYGKIINPPGRNIQRRNRP